MLCLLSSSGNLFADSWQSQERTTEDMSASTEKWAVTKPFTTTVLEIIKDGDLQRIWPSIGTGNVFSFYIWLNEKTFQKHHMASMTTVNYGYWSNYNLLLCLLYSWSVTIWWNHDHCHLDDKNSAFNSRVNIPLCPHIHWYDVRRGKIALIYYIWLSCS